ncbi:2-dehydropantoate 2-reductase [uncultured Methylobacterium sp.]|jgi:2-dehydropantoate 2-reductase|uniref:2-dehydropantoate 2-reductase n=1 Tax=uncultured Methylobacterium sp. TaxID=157278 RepID=UPI0026094244|nr:2-dehydropantoate 2-reductase [uncultured Methylobacterium sp.]
MRVLVVGAGATGGYFGARLAEAGRDVTFLVRPARAARLAADGLVVRNPDGVLRIPSPRTVTADALAGPYDLVLLSCKAYDLADAVEAVAPAVGPETAVLPVLNGMAHLDLLDARFGPGRVLGGSCAIAGTVNEAGEIVRMTDLHSLTFGERAGSGGSGGTPDTGGAPDRMAAVTALMQGVAFQARPSDRILLEMWEKWVFLAALAAGTCLMRASVGDIVAAPGGREWMLGLFEEGRAIAAAAGHAPREKVAQNGRAMLTAEGSPATASMMRDLSAGNRIEADHVVGDLIRRGRAGDPEAALPHLTTAYIHLKAYEARRA